MSFIYVALGGALGASARYATTLAVPAPVGTMVVNILGSFLMGIALVWFFETGRLGQAPLIMTGLLGGFTTFSAFSLDALRLFEDGRLGAALAYVLGSVALSLVAVVIGALTGRAVL